VAREAFPRVLALRAGALVYDGPGAGLSDELLHALYGDEAPDAPAEDEEPVDGTGASAVPRMVCR
jgi:ABC-type phosphate/phosphonate transport system ATPase subunit